MNVKDQILLFQKFQHRETSFIFHEFFSGFLFVNLNTGYTYALLEINNIIGLVHSQFPIVKVLRW